MKKTVILILALLVFCFAACEKEKAKETPPPLFEEKTLSSVSPDDILKSIDPEFAAFMSTSSGCMETLLEGVSREEVIKAFEDEDFTRLATDRVDGAKFETDVLVRESLTVTLYGDADENSVRITWERDVNNSALTKTSETGKGIIEVAQVGTERETETDNPLVGMCYVVKLSSGRAIVIDGGFNNTPCANNLHNTLETLGVAKNGDRHIIEAWIITHGHPDHSGTLEAFAELYADKVELRKVVAAYPPEINLTDTVELFEGASVINPHAGLKYYFGNATVSMLYTPDMIYTNDATLDDFNDTSLVFKIEGGGASVTFLGDAGETVSTKLLESYDSSVFASDVFQLSHHGLYTSENATHVWENQEELYRAIDAEYAFFPLQDRLEGDKRNGRYTVLVSWATHERQVSFVMNEADDHGRSEISQSYYNDFVDSVKRGDAEHKTLYGYDGINKIVSESGLVTYLGGSESEPMITVFEFSCGKVTLKYNEPLHSRL